jgi:hypothetical protein
MAKEFWDKPNPKKTHTSLTPGQEKKAKARAKAAGRPYPNLVDNVAAKKLADGGYSTPAWQRKK